MGVRGLQSFLENAVPGGCTTVDIISEARKHSSSGHSDTKPTVVVDGLSLIRWIYNRTRDFIFGGPWRDLASIVHDFVRAFQEQSIDLVFFFDGYVSDSKVEEWRIRRQRRLNDIEATFQRLRSGVWRGNDPNDYCCPNGTAYTLWLVVKCLTSCKVFYAVEECDLEAARYAHYHPECFALLSQDTDFVIFNMRVLYLSTLHLDIRNMTTCAYHSQALAYHLSLDPVHLPLFACLSGNDTVRREQHLLQFHDSIGFPAHQRVAFARLFRRIAGIIRQHGWRAIPDMSVARYTRISLDLLLEGVRSYDLEFEASHLEEPLGVDHASWYLAYRSYKEATTFPALLQILHHNEIYLGETMEEALNPNVPPAYVCFRPVRSRLYWVLFGGNDTVVVTEHVAYPGAGAIKDEGVMSTSFPFNGQVPPLYRLWSQEHEMMNVRWQLFCGCLGVRLHLDELMLMDAASVVLASTLSVMFMAGVLEEREVSAFVLQYILSEEDKHELVSRQIADNEIEAHLVSISTFFMIGLQTVTMLLSACGGPFCLRDAAPWVIFNGKLFHVLGQELAHKQSGVLERNHEVRERYHKLWRIITGKNLALMDT